MNTTLDCLVCLVEQALKSGRLASRNEDVVHRIINRAGALLQDMDLTRSPPENAVGLYRMISEESGVTDPFADLKRQSNELALSLRERLAARIAQSEDPLLSALRYAVCGNIIDYAARHRFNVNESMTGCEHQDFLHSDYEKLRMLLGRQDSDRRLLYLADNCGEIVFDGLFIKELQQLGWRVTMVVRDGVVINDATMEDARSCGIDTICRVISSGVVCPGTPLHDCSAELREAFLRADCIISKGMGNFETLSEVSGPIFFLFTVKCTVVACHLAERLGCNRERIRGQGEMVLLAQEYKHA
jgi:uncharacterized protein with ATP-grasp and redox domains